MRFAGAANFEFRDDCSTLFWRPGSHPSGPLRIVPGVMARAAGKVNNVPANQNGFRFAPITEKGGNIFYDGENDDAGQHPFDRASRHKFLADTAED